MPQYRVKVNYTALVEADDMYAAGSRALLAPARQEVSCRVDVLRVMKRNEYPKSWEGPPLRWSDVDDSDPIGARDTDAPAGGEG